MGDSGVVVAGKERRAEPRISAWLRYEAERFLGLSLGAFWVFAPVLGESQM